MSPMSKTTMETMSIISQKCLMVIASSSVKDSHHFHMSQKHNQLRGKFKQPVMSWNFFHVDIFH